MISAKQATTIATAIAAGATLLVAGCGGGGGDIGSNGRDETPIINTQPQNATVTTGTVATFAVGADGNRLHYTWLRDGQPIAGSPDRPQYSLTATYKDGNHRFSVLIVNDAGKVISQGGLLTLALTPDEKILENALFDGGYYSLDWNLAASGAQTSGVNYFFGQQTTVPQSPLNIGSVTTIESFANLSNSLPFSTDSTTPVLLANNYDFEANHGSVNLSYDVNGIEIQDLDVSGAVKGRAYTRTEMVFTPLSGPLSATPTQLKQLLNVVFSNPNVLDQTATWQPGAGYFTFKEVAANDEFIFQDCNGQPATAAPTIATPVYASFCPVTGGSDITATMTTGIPDPVNNVTHVLADGAVHTLQGTSVWEAANPNPAAYPGQTVNYLAYAQTTGGQVSQGYVIRQGTVIAGEGLETVNGVTQYPQIHFRINAQAFATLKAASGI